MKKLLLCVMAGVLALGLTKAAGAEGFGPLHQNNGLAIGSGYAYEKIAIKDMDSAVQIHQTFVRADYTFLDRVTAFGTVGGATMQIQDAFDAGKDFHSAMAPFASAGLKGSVALFKDLYLGGFVRYTLFGEMSDTDHISSFDVEASIQDFGIFAAAAGVQYDVRDRISLYAGALYRILNKGSLEIAIPAISYAKQADLEDENSLGGFGGVKVNLSRNFGISLEYGYVNSNSNLGLYLGYAF